MYNYNELKMEELKSPIKKYKPTTPGQRQRVTIREKNLSKNKPFKLLTSPTKKRGGRNHQGKITIRWRGPGHKRNLRLIDFKREVGQFSTAEILSIEYDPNRTGNIALCKIKDTSKHFYILAPQDIKIGDLIKGKKTNNQISLGESRQLKNIPTGSLIYNLETGKGKGGKIARAAGTSCTLIKNLENGQTIVRLPSKKTINISSTALASLGQVSNPSHNLAVFGKAGAKRWKGLKPHVRGTAMNAIDHPHGGKTRGSGKKGGQPRTKWGKLAKWRSTRKL